MKIKRSEAERIYKRVRPFLHHVWRDSSGAMYERSGEKPDWLFETIAWLPNAIEKNESGDYELTAIDDPLSFSEFVEHFGWEVENETE